MLRGDERPSADPEGFGRRAFFISLMTRNVLVGTEVVNLTAERNHLLTLS
jgi:hypothetical protein